MRSRKLQLMFVGTAGSGKTTACGAFSTFLKEAEVDHVVVNMDPGALTLPYEPELDVREWIDMGALMEENGLGPNGAQVLAADLVAMEGERIMGYLKDIPEPLVLIDTPGQLELFAFRPSSRHLVDTLGRESILMAFMHDAVMSRDPRNFLSQTLLYNSAELRLGTAGVHLLSKSDLISPEAVDHILDWLDDPETLGSQLISDDEGPTYAFAMQLLTALETGVASISMIPWSGMTGWGMPELLSLVENVAGWDSESST